MKIKTFHHTNFHLYYNLEPLERIPKSTPVQISASYGVVYFSETTCRITMRSFMRIGHAPAGPNGGRDAQNMGSTWLDGPNCRTLALQRHKKFKSPPLAVFFENSIVRIYERNILLSMKLIFLCSLVLCIVDLFRCSIVTTIQILW